MERSTQKVRVGVAGYGVIGQRLADGVALQQDMELVGIADVAPTLLDMLGLPKPKEMTGSCLLVRK